MGRPGERVGEIADHDRWGAATAADLLSAADVPPDRVEAVERCVRSHSIRSGSPDPASTEAKLLFDADKLDALGAVGLLRLACIVGERSGRAGERYAAVDELSPSRPVAADCPDVGLLREWMDERLAALHTPPARRLGESRRAFVDDFFGRFEREIGVGADR